MVLQTDDIEVLPLRINVLLCGITSSLFNGSKDRPANAVMIAAGLPVIVIGQLTNSALGLCDKRSSQMPVLCYILANSGSKAYFQHMIRLIVKSQEKDVADL